MHKRSRFIRPCGAMQRRPTQTGIPWIAALLTLTTGSCEPAQRDTQAAPARDSAGVTIIENRGPDEMLGIRAVRTVDLVPPDSALTAVPWGVAADPMTGRIYVADWTGQRVVAFDASGTYAGTYGREGDGPGEFRNPAAVSMDPYGALAVWDTGRQILNRWSREGRPRRRCTKCRWNWRSWSSAAGPFRDPECSLPRSSGRTGETPSSS